MAAGVPRKFGIRWLSSLVGDRGRKIMDAAGWSLLAKLASAANLFVAVPFVLHALGPTQFGAWATLVSLVYFAGFLDFGLGNGTMNLVAAAHGRGNTDEVAAVIHEARRTLVWVALGLAVVVALALPWVPWHRLLGMPPASADACRRASAAVLFAITLAVPLSLATRVQLGLGQGGRAFRWQVAGQLATLGLVVVLARANASLPVLTAATVFTPLLASLANTLALLRDRSIVPPPGRHPELARRIRSEGMLFFVLQLAAALAYSADLALISSLLGPVEAGTYSIVQRLFSIVPMGLALVWAPLWPVYRQALAARNHDWVVRTLRGSIALAFVASSCAALVLGLGFDYIVAIWVHRTLPVSGLLLTGFAAWIVIDAVGTAIATFLNAASIVRYQLIVASLFAVTCLAGKAWAVSHFGITSLPWVTVTTYAIISLIPTVLLGRKLLYAALAKHY
jgi:O-antigen/teichoic acid export membrane protein